MKFFEQLGDSIRTEWERYGRAAPAFGAIAEEHLHQCPPARHVEVDGLLDAWFLDPEFPDQGSMESAFGQPPVRVYSGPGFVIDVLFWLDGTTSIHQHGFSGAFHLLVGSSIESRYRFSLHRALGEHLQLGQLDLVGVEHLVRGAVRPIKSGCELIHSVFHLPRPTVSVVVRTWGPALGGPQFDYSLAGIASDPFWKPQRTQRLLQLLRMLFDTNPTRAQELLTRVLASASPHDMFRLLEVCRTSRGELAPCLEVVSLRHPDLAEAYQRHFEQSYRTSCLTQLRAAVESSEHRFLLAMLLTVPSRKQALSLIEAAYPGVPPKETLLRWLRELAAIKADGVGQHPLAGIQLDDVTLVLVSHLMDGCGDEQVVARLHDEFEEDEIDSQRGDIQELLCALRASPMFCNLLSVSNERA
jgi:hypothetical protein